MTFVLTYTRALLGRPKIKEHAEFEDDTTSISFVKKAIDCIDLSPLVSCTCLKELWLRENQLESLDLTPLASCTSLRKLVLDLNKLQDIDLTPLAGCTNLKELDLSHNQLETINLAPLASCTNLQLLWLHENQLETIDLSPLSSCTNLRILMLRENQLQTIDLTPLTSCTRMRQLNLNQNQLQTIDLAPLAFCTSLTLYLNENQLQSIDLTPLSSWKRSQRFWLGGNQLQTMNAAHSWLPSDYWNGGHFLKRGIVYIRPARYYSWSFLHQVAEKYGHSCRVQQDLLCALGLTNYGFIDHDLFPLFLSLPADTPIETAREQVRERLLKESALAADEKRTTVGLRIEELSNRHREIAERAKRIIELRKREMQRVQVEIRENEVELKELWLTAYGYEILTAHGMRLTTDLNGLEQIRIALSELGYELKNGETSVSAAKMSDELKQVIWWIAENQGRVWREIES